MQPTGCCLCDPSLAEGIVGATITRASVAVDCPKCGTYRVTHDAALHIRRSPNTDWHLVSGFCREATLQVDTGERIEPVVLTPENIETIQLTSPKDVIDQIDRFLLNCSRMAARPGTAFHLDPEKHRTLGYCATPEEIVFLAEALAGDGLLLKNKWDLSLTIAGWSKVRELKHIAAERTQGFVAMSFSPDMDAVFDKGIRPAIEEAGYHPYRIDREELSDRIDDRILAEIKRSRFIVCDFTGQKPGVYFEAGFGLGLGIPVIWTCKKDDLDNLHFDTRQYAHIIWETKEELRERLMARIRVLIG